MKTKEQLCQKVFFQNYPRETMALNRGDHQILRFYNLHKVYDL